MTPGRVGLIKLSTTGVATRQRGKYFRRSPQTYSLCGVTYTIWLKWLIRAGIMKKLLLFLISAAQLLGQSNSGGCG